MRVRKEEERVRYEEPEMEIVNFEKKQDVVTGSTIDNKPEKPDIDFGF